jgi:hypothetical protein
MTGSVRRDQEHDKQILRQYDDGDVPDQRDPYRRNRASGEAEVTGYLFASDPDDDERSDPDRPTIRD